MDGRDELLVPGETCWRIERADRLALIVDAAGYFRAVKAAMLAARHTIMLIGWDFDTRIAFEPQGATVEGPERLGEFLTWLGAQREDLSIHVLQWDLGVLEELGRGALPIVVEEWTTGERLHFRLDGAHPLGAAHHSKIAVIDDACAFCGGIDMTADRWDTRAHRDDDPVRATPDGEPAKPWHDATLALDGPAAAALGDLARQRWARATDEALAPPPSPRPIWPPHLAPTFEDVDVGILRTFPAYGDKAEVREIETFVLTLLESARDIVYFESQYFASRAVVDAILARLAEPDGPEIVVVMPQHAEGWLRRKAMDGARKALLEEVWQNDPHGRFAAYFPVTAGGAAIYVHAKIAIADDRVLRVGSSNLNNRSMGFDSECDVAVEAKGARDEAMRETIRAVRYDLLCEHLETVPDRFARAEEEQGGLIGAIEHLRGEGRSLRPFTPEVVKDDDSSLANNGFADPEEADGTALERIGKGLRDFVDRAIASERESDDGAAR